MLCADVCEPLVEDDQDAGPDQAEIDRVTTWWAERATTLDPALAYAFGLPATPGVFIEQAAAAESSLPDAYLNALTDWTGQDFGQSSLPAVLAEWQKWWTSAERNYEPGRRYFYGHPVP